MSPEEIQLRKKQKKEQMERLESCLVLTRAQYMQNTKTFDDFIGSHASVNPNNLLDLQTLQDSSPDEETMMKLQVLPKKAEQFAKSNENILLSKINVNQMIQCD
mmetsp:Transcript_17404/g.29289  ORF Transcript_17404/g.29289 Transcript_17404/m.29289 type:complete len:104 (+) Transcript_17404:194-505(+)